MHPHESSKRQLAITDEARRARFGLRGRLDAWTRHRDACGCCDSALHVRSTQYKACQNNNAAGDQQCLVANSGKRARKTITLVRSRTRVAHVLGFADASTSGRDTGTLVGVAIPLHMHAAPNTKLVKTTTLPETNNASLPTLASEREKRSHWCAVAGASRTFWVSRTPRRLDATRGRLWVLRFRFTCTQHPTKSW